MSKSEQKRIEIQKEKIKPDYYLVSTLKGDLRAFQGPYTDEACVTGKMIRVVQISRCLALEKENEDLSIKLQRTVNAAYHALLETTAWLGIPDHKRENWISEAMSNVKYCAEHDCRHIDESQRNNELRDALKKCADFAANNTNGKDQYNGDAYGFILKIAKKALGEEK